MYGSAVFLEGVEKALFYLIFHLSFPFILSLLLYVMAYFYGSRSILGWEINETIERLLITIDSFEIHLFQLEVNTDNFLIFQEYTGGTLELNRWTSYLLLGCTTVFVILYFSVTSNLNRFWYFIFTSLGILILLSLKFEQLLLFGSNSNSGFIVALLFYIPLSYYFQAFGTSHGFLTRFFSFALSTIVLGVLIWIYSETGEPFLLLGQYGIAAPIIISSVFILITAQEFIYLFLWIITGNTSTFTRNNPVHFTILSLFYIINLILVWLKNTLFIDWDILFIDAFFLFPVAAIIGIWGFRAKSKTLAGILPFYPYGGILYLMMGVVSFFTLSYFFFTGNDPVNEAFEDLIVYSQFGLGLLFFIYILANFYTLLDNNMKVYKVVYDPKRMPYITANIAGIIGMVALFAKSGFLAYDQVRAGYYNGLGDLYSLTEDVVGAESYYELGVLYSAQNHRSNYSLGSFYHERGELSDALFYYKRSIKKKPTPQAYVNTALLYRENGLLFDALFTLQEAVKKYPGNGKLLNNLGTIYAETNILDSAAYYYYRASIESSTSDIGQANLSGLLAKHDLLPNPNVDSLLLAYTSTENLPLQNNTLVLSNKTGFPANDISYLPVDTLLQSSELAIIGNQLIGKRYLTNPEHLEDLDNLVNNYSLGSLEEEIKLSMAFNQYYNGNISASIEIMQDLFRSSYLFREKFGLMLGKMLMRQKAYKVAIPILANSGIGNNVRRNLAICLLEDGQIEDARMVWQEVASQNAEDIMAIKVQRILSIERIPDHSELDDQDKYLMVRYRYRDFYPEELKSLADGIKNEYLKPMSYLLLYKNAGELGADPEQFYSLMEETNPVSGFVDTDHLEVQLQRFEDAKDWGKMEEILNTIDNQDPRLVWMVNYYRGILELNTGNSDNANAYFDKLIRNPFYEKGVIESVRYFDSIGETERAYEIALEAMQVNPNSSRLMMSYTRLASKLGLDNYVKEILLELRENLSPEDFNSFQAEIEEIKPLEEAYTL